MTNFGGVLSGMKTLPNKVQFAKDAGSLANGLDRSEQKASSQILVFYFCPSSEVWDTAPLYKNKDYAPQVDPAQYKDLLQKPESGLQYMADAWGTEIWYMVDRTGQFYLISAGEDTKFNTDDDFIYDGGSNSISKRESLVQSGGVGGNNNGLRK